MTGTVEDRHKLGWGLAALVVAGLIYLLGGIITRPIVKLAQAVKDLPQQPALEAIHSPHFGREIKSGPFGHYSVYKPVNGRKLNLSYL